MRTQRKVIKIMMVSCLSRQIKNRVRKQKRRRMVHMIQRRKMQIQLEMKIVLLKN